MNTDESSAQAGIPDPVSTPSASAVETPIDPPHDPPVEPPFEPKPLGLEDFHPAVVAVSRIEASGRKFAQRTKALASNNDLIRLTGELMAAVGSDDADMDECLRTQSALINKAFNTLLLKATRDDGFDAGAFESALRAQRQYRMTCQTLRAIKKAQEQTEAKARKDYIESVRKDPRADPYAYQHVQF